MDLIAKSIDGAKYKPGKEVFIALDVASSEFYKNKFYNLSGESLNLKSEPLIKYYENLLDNYPIIISIEDGLDEEDWAMENLTNALGMSTCW